MAVPVMMPRQGQSVESCIITEWTRQKGDKVSKGDTIMIYETDKASFELEAPEEGILLDIFFQADDDVPVLTNVAVIGQEGENYDEFKPEGTASSAESTGATEEQPVTSSSTEDQPTSVETQTEIAVSETETEDGFLKISPRARNLAEKSGIAVQGIKGTGPEGRIIEQDVQKHLESAPKSTPLAREKAKAEGLELPASGSGIGGRVTSKDLQAPAGAPASDSTSIEGDFELRKLSNMRKIIAQNMHRSLQNSAQLTHHTSADARKMLALRKAVKKRMETGGDNITLNDMVCYAVVKALKKHPEANSHFLGDQIRVFKNVHLGFAVDTDRGLMVPSLRNASDLSLSGLANRLKQLAEQCKKGNIDPELLSSESATFTVSNLGAFGVELFTPVINLPQAGILGVNTIIHRPGDTGDGVIGFIPVIGLSLTYDHRALDGAPASRFLYSIREEIENLDLHLID